MPGFGSLAPGQDTEDDLIDWHRMNQPFGDISPPPDPILGTLGRGTPYERPITQSDVDRGIRLGLMSSGGGIGAAEGLMSRARVPILKYAAGRRHPAAASIQSLEGGPADQPSAETPPSEHPTPTQTPSDDVDWGRMNAPFGSLKPASASPTEHVTSAIQDTLMAGGMQPYRARHLGEGLTGIGTMNPYVGIPLSAADAVYSKMRGDTPGTVMAMAGMIPGVGPEARAASEAAREVPRTWWSDLAKTRHPIPVEEMSATRVPTGELAPRSTVPLESLEGSIAIPAVGDRTMAGHVLTHVNEAPLSRPVPLEGGPDFMRAAANRAQGSVWAADLGAINQKAAYARQLAERGKPLVLIHSAMGGRSGDFSTMMSDALLSQMAGSKITAKGLDAFDTAMKARSPDFPGIRDPNLRATLMDDPGMRKNFVETMALGEHQKAGFPEIGSTRYAISQPEMIGMPTGTTGYALSRLDPAGRVIRDPQVPHGSYPVQLGGQGYLGRLEKPVPRQLIFPDFYAQRRAMRADPQFDDRSFSLGNVSQEMTPQVLENIMRYWKGGR